MTNPALSPPQKIDKKALLALILAAGTLIYLIAVFWTGIGSIRHVMAINASAKEASAETDQNGATAQGEATGQEGTTAEAKAPEPYPLSDFVVKVLLIVGTALATHLGAFLGIAITQSEVEIKDLKGWLNYLLSYDGLPGGLAIVYIFTLLIAILFWAFTGFSIYAAKPLQDLGYSFLGVFAGAMAALSKG